MVASMRRVAAISAGPRSASPRGRRALSLLAFSGFSAMIGVYPERSTQTPAARGREQPPPRRARNAGKCQRHSNRAQPPPSPPNSTPIGAPSAANRAFKPAPRRLARAKDSHYYPPDGRAVLDGPAGLWCTNAGHNRDPIVEAIRAQAAQLDYAPAFQFSHPKAFELASRVAA